MGDTVDRPLANSADIWAYFIRSAGLSPTGYDAGLVEELHTKLGVPGDADLMAHLSVGAVPPERFVPALLSVLAPFARMISELCAFFERHDVVGTGNGLRIAFDFDAPTPPLEFDLAHFRAWSSAWETVWRLVHEPAWDYGAIWQLPRILWDAADATGVPYDDGEDDPWFQTETRSGDGSSWNDVPPLLAPALAAPAWADTGVRAAIEGVQQLVAAVMRERGAHFASYRDVVLAVRAGEVAAPRSAVPLAAWGRPGMAALEHDRFVAGTSRALLRWLRALGTDAGREAASEVAGCIAAVFASRPMMPTEHAVPRRALLDVLDLPVWKKRHELYGTWLITLVERALPGYPLRVHHQDGILRIRFAQTAIGTFRIGAADVELVAEWRTALDAPTGKGRTGAIQPDYALRPGGDPDPSHTYAVIEAKQYKSPKPLSFAQALNDYARGHPNATVLLLDYGPMSDGVAAHLDPADGWRTRAFGDVQPEHPNRIAEAAAGIADALARVPGAVTTVILDVSSSMQAPLRDEGVVAALHELAARFPHATWVAFDTDVVAEGTGAVVLEAVAAYQPARGTDLPAALQYHDPSHCLVVTDEDGEAQLRAHYAGEAVDVTPLGAGAILVKMHRTNFT